MDFFLDYNKEDISDKYERVVVSDYFLGDNVCAVGKKKHIIEAPFLDGDKYNEASIKRFDISERLCVAVSGWINRQYGIVLSPKQAGYIFGAFFDKHVYMILERYTRVRQLNMKNLFFEIPRNDVVGIMSYGDIMSDYYNAYIYGNILRQLGANELTDNRGFSVNREREAIESIRGRLGIYLVDLFTQPNRIGYNIRRLNGYRHLFVRLPKNQISCRSLLIRTFLAEDMENRIVEESRGRVYSLDPNVFVRKDLESYRTREVDVELREDFLKDFSPKDLFETILKEVIIGLVPLSLCENFYFTYKSVEPLTKLFRADKMYSAGLYSGALAIFAALMSKEGTKIIDIQHSGSYLSDYPTGLSEAHTFDEFLTWGDYGKYPYGYTRSVAPVRIVDKKKNSLSKSKEIERILLISNDTRLYDAGDGYYDPGFANRHLGFVKALSKEWREKVVVRHRNDTIGLLKRYENEFPEIKHEFEIDCPVSKSIAQSDVIVLDLESSVYYEALISGKPTFLFEGLRYPLYFGEMKKWIKKLKGIGIYSSNPEQIASYIMYQGDNIVERWNEPIIQSTVDSFLEYAMNMSIDIQEAWKKEWCS